MPRRGSRAYLTATLQAHVRRAFRRILLEVEEHAGESRADFERQLGAFRKQLEFLRKYLPSDVVLTVEMSGTFEDDPLTINLDFAAISTEELAQAVALFSPVPRGSPAGRRRSIVDVGLLMKVDAAVTAGEGSVRSVCERFAKRDGISAETLRKQYRRYRRYM